MSPSPSEKESKGWKANRLTILAGPPMMLEPGSPCQLILMNPLGPGGSTGTPPKLEVISTV
jgi:hypothetical protein